MNKIGISRRRLLELAGAGVVSVAISPALVGSAHASPATVTAIVTAANFFISKQKSGANPLLEIAQANRQLLVQMSKHLIGIDGKLNDVLSTLERIEGNLKKTFLDALSEDLGDQIGSICFDFHNSVKSHASIVSAKQEQGLSPYEAERFATDFIEQDVQLAFQQLRTKTQQLASRDAMNGIAVVGAMYTDIAMAGYLKLGREYQRQRATLYNRYFSNWLESRADNSLHQQLENLSKSRENFHQAFHVPRGSNYCLNRKVTSKVKTGHRCKQWHDGGGGPESGGGERCVAYESVYRTTTSDTWHTADIDFESTIIDLDGEKLRLLKPRYSITNKKQNCTSTESISEKPETWFDRKRQDESLDKRILSYNAATEAYAVLKSTQLTIIGAQDAILREFEL